MSIILTITNRSSRCKSWLVTISGTTHWEIRLIRFDYVYHQVISSQMVCSKSSCYIYAYTIRIEPTFYVFQSSSICCSELNFSSQTAMAKKGLCMGLSFFYQIFYFSLWSTKKIVQRFVISILKIKILFWWLLFVLWNYCTFIIDSRIIFSNLSQLFQLSFKIWRVLTQ